MDKRKALALAVLVMLSASLIAPAYAQEIPQLELELNRGTEITAPIYITVKNTDTVLPLPEVDLIIAIDTGGGDGSNWLPEFWNFQTGSIIKAFSSAPTQQGL